MQALKIRFKAIGQKTDGPIKLMYRNVAAIELSSLLKKKKNNAKLLTLHTGGSFYAASWSDPLFYFWFEYNLYLDVAFFIEAIKHSYETAKMCDKNCDEKYFRVNRHYNGCIRATQCVS